MSEAIITLDIRVVLPSNSHLTCSHLLKNNYAFNAYVRGNARPLLVFIAMIGMLGELMWVVVLVATGETCNRFKDEVT